MEKEVTKTKEEEEFRKKYVEEPKEGANTAITVRKAVDLGRAATFAMAMGAEPIVHIAQDRAIVRGTDPSKIVGYLFDVPVDADGEASIQMPVNRLLMNMTWEQVRVDGRLIVTGVMRGHRVRVKTIVSAPSEDIPIEKLLERHTWTDVAEIHIDKLARAALLQRVSFAVKDRALWAVATDATNAVAIRVAELDITAEDGVIGTYNTKILASVIKAIRKAYGTGTEVKIYKVRGSKESLLQIDIGTAGTIVIAPMLDQDEEEIMDLIEVFE